MPVDSASDGEGDPSLLATTRDHSHPLEHGPVPTLDELRAALGDAIRDRAWRVVEIIQGQVEAAERAALPANVVPMVARRGERT